PPRARRRPGLARGGRTIPDDGGGPGMITTASVERRISAMLADEGLVRAPEGALADVLTVVDGTTQRRRTWPSPVIPVPRMAASQRLIVALAAALLIAGIVVAGALLARPPDPSKDLS